MINPAEPTNLLRLRPALEEFTLFSTMVPTKPAYRMAQILENMLSNARLVYGEHLTPFDIVRLWIDHGILEQVLRRYSIGQYTRLARCWHELVVQTPILRHGVVEKVVEVDLRDIRTLERIHGIGPKTARFIVLHSVAGTRCIPIDTHWIKELRERDYPIHVTVKDGKQVVTVNERTHPIYEAYALQEVQLSRMTCAEYDLKIWRKWNEATTRRVA